jgi:histidinol-phosphate/aromatic aminotransferase/cobyric acid decarboxylase-like protein
MATMISREPRDVPAPGPHGGDGPKIAAALGIDPNDVLDLSVNLNPFAPNVIALAAPELDALRRYPDIDEAESTVADMVGVDRRRLVLTAGGAQAIALVADHLGCGWVDEPEFSLYRRHLSKVTPGAPRWRSDPHNPTGQLAPRDTQRLAGGPGTGDGVAVWDEAFLPLSAGTWTRGRPGWALGSFTKAFACPGLRLGFAVAPDPEAAGALRARRPAWAVGGLACALIPHLAKLADPPGWTKRISAARRATAEVLRNHGWAPRPSQAPWLLVPQARGLRTALAREAVVVRDCTSFGLPNHVRIAVADDEGLARLDGALAAACSRHRTSR